MQKSAKLLAASFLALSANSLSNGAQATEACFQLDPFIDFLRLESPLVSGATHVNVYGNWIAPGLYTLPVSGALEFDLGSTTVRRLGIVGTNATTFFGDNLICGLDGIEAGSFEANCSGGTSNTNFQGSGTLTRIPCAGLAPSIAAAAPTGKALGAE